MEDAIDYGNVTFTVQEAKELRNQFIRLVIERDALIEKLEAHREVLAELEDIRKFLAGDPAPFIATAATNGHLATARAHAAGERPRSDDAAPAREQAVDTEPQLHTAGEPPAADRGEHDADDTAPGRPADDRAELCGETAAGDLQNPLHLEDSDQATRTVTPAPETPAASTELVAELVTRPTADGAHERPPQGTLMERILTAIEASDRPRRGWHLQKELNLPRVPTPELSRLVKRGFLTRHGESIYGVVGRAYGSSKSC